MRAQLIFNPSATTTDHGVRDALAGLLGNELDLRVVATRERNHATALAQAALEDGVDAVFALGGDGTANEVMQALAGTDVPLGLLPGGGTNVLARALGLPNDPAGAAAIQLERLQSGGGFQLGLGRLNGRWFGFQGGIGLDAAIVARVEAAPRMKATLHQLAFVLLGLREWATNVDRDDPAAVITSLEHLDGTTAVLDDVPRMIVTAGNVDPYTYLGRRPLRLTPGATPSGGLEVLTVGPMPTWRVLRAVGRAFAGADHDRDESVTIHHSVRSCTVRAHRPVDLMVDGDHIGRAETAELSHHPAMLRTLAEPPVATPYGQVPSFPRTA